MQYRCALTLTVTASCPGGGPITVRWSQATPNAQVALLFARTIGSFAIPGGNPCAGTRLGLGSRQIRLAWHGPSDANGAGTLNANAPGTACGGYLQLLDVPTCITSSVVQIE